MHCFDENFPFMFGTDVGDTKITAATYTTNWNFITLFIGGNTLDHNIVGKTSSITNPEMFIAAYYSFDSWQLSQTYDKNNRFKFFRYFKNNNVYSEVAMIGQISNTYIVPVIQNSAKTKSMILIINQSDGTLVKKYQILSNSYGQQTNLRFNDAMYQSHTNLGKFFLGVSYTNQPVYGVFSFKVTDYDEYITQNNKGAYKGFSCPGLQPEECSLHSMSQDFSQTLQSLAIGGIHNNKLFIHCLDQATDEYKWSVTWPTKTETKSYIRYMQLRTHNLVALEEHPTPLKKLRLYRLSFPQANTNCNTQPDSQRIFELYLDPLSKFLGFRNIESDGNVNYLLTQQEPRIIINKIEWTGSNWHLLRKFINSPATDVASYYMVSQALFIDKGTPTPSFDQWLIFGSARSITIGDTNSKVDLQRSKMHGYVYPTNQQYFDSCFSQTLTAGGLNDQYFPNVAPSYPFTATGSPAVSSSTTESIILQHVYDADTDIDGVTDPTQPLFTEYNDCNLFIGYGYEIMPRATLDGYLSAQNLNYPNYVRDIANDDYLLTTPLSPFQITSSKKVQTGHTCRADAQRKFEWTYSWTTTWDNTTTMDNLYPVISKGSGFGNNQQLMIDFRDNLRQFHEQMTVVLKASLPGPSLFDQITFNVKNLHWCKTGKNKPHQVNLPGSNHNYNMWEQRTQPYTIWFTYNTDIYWSYCKEDNIRITPEFWKISDASPTWKPINDPFQDFGKNGFVQVTRQDNIGKIEILDDFLNYLWSDYKDLRGQYKFRLKIENSYTDYFNDPTLSNEITINFDGCYVHDYIDNEIVYTVYQANEEVKELQLPLVVQAVANTFNACEVKTTENPTIQYYKSSDDQDHSHVANGLSAEVFEDPPGTFKHRISTVSSALPNNQHSGLIHELFVKIKYQPHFNLPVIEKFVVFKLDLRRDCSPVDFLDNSAIGTNELIDSTYILTQSQVVLQFSLYNSNDAFCKQKYEITVSESQTGTPIQSSDFDKYIQIDSDNRLITWQNDHPSVWNYGGQPEGKQYTVTVIASFDEPDAINSPKDDKNSFVITVKHWCWLVQFEPLVINTAEYYLKDTNHPYQDQSLHPMTVQVPKFTAFFDYKGTIIGDTNLTTTCGPWQLSLGRIDDELNQNPVALESDIFNQLDSDITNMQIIVESDDKSLVKDYEGYRLYPFKMSGYLKDYVDVSTQTIFNVALKDPCFKVQFIPPYQFLQNYDQTPYQEKHKYKYDYPSLLVEDYSWQGSTFYDYNDYCGPTDFELHQVVDGELKKFPTDLFSIKFDDSERKLYLEIYTENFEYMEKNVPMTLRMFVKHYDHYPQGFFNFNVYIKLCVIDHLDRPKNDNIHYLFDSGRITISASGKYHQHINCQYPAVITSRFKNGTEFDQSKIKFNYGQQTISWTINIHEVYDVGVHKMVVNYKAGFKNMYEYQDVMEIDLDVFLKMRKVDHQEPIYENNDFPEKTMVIIGDIRSYSSGKPSEDSVAVNVNVEGDQIWYQFIKYSINEKLEVDLEIQPTSEDHIGVYKIIIILHDNGSDSKQGPKIYWLTEKKRKVYEFEVTITKPSEGFDFEKYFFQNNGQNKNVASRNQGCRFDCVPKMRLQSVSSLGLVKFEFNQDMIVSPFIKEQKGNYTYGKQFTNETIRIEIVPGVKQNTSRMDFEWYVAEFEPRELTIQVVFKDAIFISMAETRDILKIGIVNQTYFVSEETGYSINERQFKYSLGYQMIFGGSSSTLLATSESVEKGMQGMAIGNLVMNVALSGSLMHLWGMINSLQIIFHMPGNNLALPANAQSVYATFISITQFNVLPESILSYFYFWNYGRDIEESRELILRKLAEEGEEDSFFIEEEQFNPTESNMAAIGYEQIDAVGNLQTLYLILLYMIMMIILLAFSWVIKEVSAETRLYLWLKKFLLWAPILRLLQEGYIEFAVVCFINIRFRDMQVSTGHNDVSYFLTMILSGSLVIFPIFIITFLYKTPEDQLMNDKEIIRKYGEIFNGLKLQRKRGLSYYVIFTLRRLLFAYIIVYLQEYPWLQVQLNLYIQTFMILYLGFWRPWSNPFSNKLEFFNEIATLFIVYHMACFSNFYHDIEVRYYLLGNTFIYSTYIIIAVNTCVVLLQFYHTCKVDRRKRQMHQNYQNQLDRIAQIKKASEKYSSTYDVTKTKDQKLKEDFAEAVKRRKRKLMGNLLMKQHQKEISLEEKIILKKLQDREQRKQKKQEWKRQYESLPQEYKDKANEAGEKPDSETSSLQSDEVLENVEKDFKDRNDPTLHKDYVYLANQVRQFDFRCQIYSRSQAWVGDSQHFEGQGNIVADKLSKEIEHKVRRTHQLGLLKKNMMKKNNKVAKKFGETGLADISEVTEEEVSELHIKIEEEKENNDQNMRFRQKTDQN